MNINKAKILLDKINVLMRSMSVAPEHIADIEQDLMKNYIRQFYEAVLEEDAPLPVSKPAPPKAIPEPVVVPPPPPAPVPTPAPVAAVKVAPVAPVPPPVAAPEVEMEVVAPTPKPTPKPKPPAISAELEDVFMLSSSASDLGEKLSQSPIKNLTKAFSINEKLFTIKELFGENNALFNDTIKQLDNMSSFDEAKSFLVSSVAGKYDWGHKSRIKKAKEFVKLIKRRYN